ncbi:hypothetical protein AAK899_10880 [Erysipelotrichaceae bacterium 51-3]|uniref:hypothetical protein n=1 Tax=Allobaculum sp. JKK-2023 TaxID=3108943 RepID=UPI002B05F2C0|nr:hypothetical protein [Allobaculum sp. JKK-2023]
MNITNHASQFWSKSQTEAARQLFGTVIDLPFPQIQVQMTDKEIDDLVEIYLKKVTAYENPTVLCQGEFVFTYRMVHALQKRKIQVVAAQGTLEREEYQDKDQNTVKRTIYRFARFLKY